MNRLSHLIIVQVIFVFVALGLLIFSPHRDVSIAAGEGKHYSGFANLAERLTPILHDTGPVQHHDQLIAMVKAEPSIRDAAVYVCDDDGLTCIEEIHRDEEMGTIPWDESNLLLLDSYDAEKAQTDSDVHILPVALNDEYVVYCYPVELADHTAGMFVAAWDHNLFLWDRGALGYALLLLFLAAALVALLTVYLIRRHFAQPLKQMTDAFEKTGEGELYYLIENSGEAELSRLAGVFNKLSRTLLNGQKQLKAYDDRLRVTAMSLEESQQLLSAVIDNSPVGVVTVDADNRVVLFNRMAITLFGFEDGDPIGCPLTDFVANHARLNAPVSDGESDEPGFEVLARRRDGSQFPAYLIASPLTSEDGTSMGCVYMVRDISQSKDFQHMMIRLDRYYTKGEMASEIAHEINNYLSILLGNVELVPLLIRKGNQERLDAKLELMHATIEKIARFTDGLLDGSHDEVRFCRADINQLVENVLAFLKPQNRFDHIEVTTDLSADVPLVEIDPALMQQVLVNLIYNAGDAVNEIEENRRIRVSTYLVEGATVPTLGIRVEDNGPGVHTDKLPLLFKKRFTTKPNGHGIGLITCRKILDSHLGEIGYDYADGARFTLTVPVEHGDTSAEEDASPATTPESTPA